MERILGYAKKYWTLYFTGTLALVIGFVLDLFNPVITGRLIDDVVIGGDREIFRFLLLAIIGITIGRAITGYAKEMLFDYVGIRIVSDLRKELFSHIQGLSFSYFDNNNTGELMARVKDDGENILYGVSFGIMLLIEQGLYFVVATIIIFTINYKLALISFAFIPITGFMAVKLQKLLKQTYEDISEENARLNSVAQENISGVRLVKAFAREKYEISKFLKKNQDYYNLNIAQGNIWAKYFPVLEFITNILPVLVIVVGGYFVINEEMTYGELVKFFGYIYMLIWPVRIGGWLTTIISRANASINKIEDIFNKESEILSPMDPVSPIDKRGHIIMRNVSFSLNDKSILKDINFEIKSGKTLAIMGETGAGKTSIINLLLRYYDADSGEIIIDGINIKDYDLEELRDVYSLVMQDVFLFSDTIERNITFGSGDLSEEKINSAIKDAKADGFVSELSDERQTIIGERGIGLSGGQKQRLSIARALAKKAKVLILDDATSALDMETEREIQKNIHKRKDESKIIIGHRISAVKDADEILVLDKGEIIERGTHEDLLALEGKYYMFYSEQYEAFEEYDASKAI